MQVVYENQANWLLNRKSSIGGSECSAIVGLNPYMTNAELWELKTGQKQAKDISDKPFVMYGHNAEKHLVSLFALDYPDYEVIYNDNYRVNYHDEYDFISCTRDCDLIEKSTGKKGALEIKTTEILSSMHKEKWNEQVPQNYYCQILQYFITDKELEFVWLKAQIKSDFGKGQIRLTTKHYYFTREQCQEDIDWLLKNEINFWQKCVLGKQRPNLILPNI